MPVKVTEVVLRVAVDDPVALYRFAAEIAKSYAFAPEKIGTEAQPDIAACVRLAVLRHGFAPGVAMLDKAR